MSAPESLSSTGAQGARAWSRDADTALEVTFLGVRGSTPAPGAEFAGFGGHTSCIALGFPGAPPALLLDAGTGIRDASALLRGRPFEGTILLSHLHWDHVQGLPFFTAADRADARTTLLMPSQGDLDGERLLGGMMSPPYFPIDPTDLKGEWRFQLIDEGSSSVESFTVMTRELPHKGGRTFGFRVQVGPADGRGSVSVAYLPDHGPTQLGAGRSGFGLLHEAALDLASGATLLVHGGQFTVEEGATAHAFGHATIEYALELADAAGVGALLVTHHSPSRTDDALEAMERSYVSDPATQGFARQGQRIVLGMGPRSDAHGGSPDLEGVVAVSTRATTGSSGTPTSLK